MGHNRQLYTNWILRPEGIIMRTLLLLILGVVLLACSQSNVDTPAALAAIEQGAVVIDVRTDEEVKDGMLPGAIHIPHQKILEGVSALNLSNDDTIVLHCRSGNRSGMAASMLQAEGYTHIINGGGYRDLIGNSPG